MEAPEMPTALSSWKEIAKFLNCGVRTVQRWEQDHRLPVHRIGRTPRSPVFAFESEVLDWLHARGDNVQNLSGGEAPQGRSHDLRVLHHELVETSKRLRAEHQLAHSKLHEALLATQRILGLTQELTSTAVPYHPTIWRISTRGPETIAA